MILDNNNSFIIDLDKNINQNNFFNIIYSDQNIIINILDNINNINKPIYLVNNNNITNNITINSGNNNKLILIDHKNNQNNNTYINCQDNTELVYYLIQNNTNANLYFNQYNNSLVKAAILNVTGHNNKLNLTIDLLAKNAIIYLNILQNSIKNYSNNINLLIRHLAPNSSSYTVARALANDKSVAGLTGKITVDPKAHNTIADLQSKGLLLSRQATINSSPELDIGNKDIICTHGASIGSFDQESLLYMQTRSIELNTAKQMLLQAFIYPIINAILIPAIINYLNI